MVSIRSINPMVRAVGTMGAVAAVVGGITFAALTSNTVALSPNTLDITCSNTGHAHGTLNQFTGGTPLGSLNAGASTDCQATAELSSSFSGTGKTVNSFDIQFVGTQSTTQESNT
jgi:hypothetical protein